MHGFGRSEQAEAEQSYSAAPSSLSREAASIDGGKEGREGQGRMTSVGRSSEAREKRREQRNDDRPNQLSLSQARTCTYRSFSSSRKMAKATAARSSRGDEARRGPIKGYACRRATGNGNVH